MEKLVSIIMPSYNSERFIEQSIFSVINQTYQNWELIIIDDNSTDNTINIIKEFKNDKIILIQNESNCGAALSRNKGIIKANGDYIAFLDSDDLWDKDKLKKQITFMEKNNYHFSFSNYRQIDSNNNCLGKTISGPKKVSYSSLKVANWMGCLTVIYRVEKIGKFQIIDLKRRNDYALWLKISKTTPSYLLNETLASYRVSKNSLSKISKRKLIKYHYIMWKSSEKLSVLEAAFLTLLNVVGTIFKIILYENRKVKNNVNKEVSSLS